MEHKIPIQEIMDACFLNSSTETRMIKKPKNKKLKDSVDHKE